MTQRSVLIAGTLLGLLCGAPAWSQAPAPAYLVVTFDLRSVNGQVRGTEPTDLTDTVPPTMTVNLPFPPEGLQQPGMLVHLAGRVTDVPCPDATRWTGIQGINARLDTVGTCYTPGEPIYGFYRTGLGELTPLQVPGATLTEAQDINNGRTVTGAFVDQAGAGHGFLWHPRTGRFRQLDVPFPGGVWTCPLALNNLDEVVGVYHNPPGRTYGFLYRSRTDTWVHLDVPDTDVTTVTSINDDGVILGRSDSARDGSSLFVYQDGTFAPFPSPYPVGDRAPVNVVALNNRGQLLGTYEQQLPPEGPEGSGVGLTRGFLATPLREVAPGWVQRLARSPSTRTAQAMTDRSERRSLVLAGCPGDGQARPGKLASSWTLCATRPR